MALVYLGVTKKILAKKIGEDFKEIEIVSSAYSFLHCWTITQLIKYSKDVDTVCSSAKTFSALQLVI